MLPKCKNPPLLPAALAQSNLLKAYKNFLYAKLFGLHNKPN